MKNNPDDRGKAIGYIEQAIAVMEEHNESDQVSSVAPSTSAVNLSSLTPWMKRIGFSQQPTMQGSSVLSK